MYCVKLACTFALAFIALALQSHALPATGTYEYTTVRFYNGPDMIYRIIRVRWVNKTTARLTIKSGVCTGARPTTRDRLIAHAQGAGLRPGRYLLTGTGTPGESHPAMLRLLSADEADLGHCRSGPAFVAHCDRVNFYFCSERQ